MLVTHATPPRQALKRATSTIPIVMLSVGDPVRAGLVTSLARSGNNITGLSNITTNLVPKQIELLKGLAPGLTRLAVFTNPATAGLNAALIEGTARELGVGVVPLAVRSAADIESGFNELVQRKAQGLLVTSDSAFLSLGPPIAALALKHRVAMMSSFREVTTVGGLASYGPAVAADYRRGAAYVDRILKGAKPTDLPIEQPTLVELVVNMKTARALGIAVPQDVLLRAATVIQ